MGAGLQPALGYARGGGSSDPPGSTHDEEHDDASRQSRSAAFLAGTFATTVTQGQADKWYPSRWGAADQRGAANRLTPAKVLDAKAMITKGTVYQLGRVYEAGMPLFGSRHYSLKVPVHVRDARARTRRATTTTSSAASSAQIGTQFDGLGHVGIGELFYNGNRRADFATPDGLQEARRRERRAPSSRAAC